jgi:DNA adenine methylase
VTSRRVLRAPFPWYGGKSLAAPAIWRAFGNVPNYVEPFAGSLATLLARPHAPKVETANDKDGLISNFWRAVQHAPDDVARWADWPVNEADLHARHRWLVEQALPLTEKLVADPEYYDAKVAGWWVWGISAWIGNGWCSVDERLHRCLPKVGGPGHGINAPSRKKPKTNRDTGVHAQHRKTPRNARGATGVVAVTPTSDGLIELFEELCARLRGVRICCGDWMRVLGRSTLGIDTAHGMTPCGVLLDPPYAHGAREKRLYREDSASLSHDVRTWALANGDNPQLRIALCGWEGEHDMPSSWTRISVRTKGSGKNRDKERIWFSPHCLQIGGQADLFEERVEASEGACNAA